MKKIFIAALFAVALCSCTSESYFEEPTTVTANSTVFDEEAARMDDLFIAIKDIVNVHKDFDYFQAALPKDLCAKMLSGKYSLIEGIEILRYWYEADECYDIMCEWPTWDDFIRLLPDELLWKYEFYL